MVVTAVPLPAASSFRVVELAGINDDFPADKLEVCQYFLQILRFKDDVVVILAVYVVFSQEELRLAELTISEGSQVKSSAVGFEVCLLETLPS